MKTEETSQESVIPKTSPEEKKKTLLCFVEKSLTHLLLLKNNVKDWDSLQTILQNVQKIKVGSWDLDRKPLASYSEEFEVFLAALSRSRVTVDDGALLHIKEALEDIKKLI